MYIAMMKALAQEVVEKISAKLKPLGIKVKELTGTSSSAARKPRQLTACGHHPREVGRHGA